MSPAGVSMVSVAIIGGGIGGLTVALALADAGVSEINIYESTPSPGPRIVASGTQPARPWAGVTPPAEERR